LLPKEKYVLAIWLGIPFQGLKNSHKVKKIKKITIIRAPFPRQIRRLIKHSTIFVLLTTGTRPKKAIAYGF
jgi:hypothetical protein